MDRVTKADLDQLVTIIRNATGDEGYFIEYASGHPRLYLDVAGSVEEVSPRLSARELLYWLDGFSEALLARPNPHVPTDVMALVNLGQIPITTLLKFGQVVIDERGDKALWVSGDYITSGDEEDLPAGLSWEEVSVREAQRIVDDEFELYMTDTGLVEDE